jgi:hypothetical protein
LLLAEGKSYASDALNDADKSVRILVLNIGQHVLTALDTLNKDRARIADLKPAVFISAYNLSKDKLYFFNRSAEITGACSRDG